jgi:nucleoside-diphosphate-sugar epimerase
LNGIEAVIHLANVANDPSVELNPTFSWEVNVLHTTQFLELCKRAKSVKKFMFASSGSVYGVKSEPNVTEELSLVPISAYNKTKMSAERVCLSYAEYFDVICVRPATVCGVSLRMRFDVVVNMFVLQAFTKSKITVLGGEQVRPNIHIDDMACVYTHFLGKNGLGSGIYNAGFENISVMDIAKMVQEVFKVEIEVKPSNDPRSYRQDSTKLLETGFVRKKSVSDAISEIATKLKNGEVKDDERWHTVKWMTSEKIGLK